MTATKQKKTKRRSRRSTPQQRGIEKRRRIIKSAEQLLSVKPLEDVSYSEIVKNAGLQVGSCYHLFRTKFDLIKAFVEQQNPLYLEYLFSELDTDIEIESWEDLVDLIIDRTISYYEEHKAAREILIGGHAPVEVAISARNRERKLATRILDLFEQFFVLPNVGRLEKVFYNFIEIADRLLAIDYMDNGEITAEGTNEVKLATKSYLQNYLPRKLKLRTTVLPRNEKE